MKAYYTTRNGRVTFEVEAPTYKALYKATGQLQNNLEPDEVCGLCGSAELHYSVRTKGDHEFYALRCANCDAALGFAQRRDDKNVFARRQDVDHRPLPNRGWSKLPTLGAVTKDEIEES